MQATVLHVTIFVVKIVRIKDTINGLVCKRGNPNPQRTNLPIAHQGGQILLKTVVINDKTMGKNNLTVYKYPSINDFVYKRPGICFSYKFSVGW